MKGLSKTEHNFMLKALSGSKNVFIDDNVGIPSMMVRIPRFNISDVVSGGPDTPHPMFIIDGKIKDEIYVGKYLANVYDDRAYSLADIAPYNNVPFPDALRYASNKGEGWHVMTNSEWSGLALWSKMNGTLPRGNNNNGKSYDKSFEYGMLTKSSNSQSNSKDEYCGGYLYDAFIPVFGASTGNVFRMMGENVYPLSYDTTEKRSVAVDKNKYTYVVDYTSSTMGKYFAGNKVKTISLGVSAPSGLCVDRDNNLWVSTSGASIDHILKLSNDVVVKDISLGGSTSACNKMFCDNDNNVWGVLTGENRLIKINTIDYTTTIYGGFTTPTDACFRNDGFIFVMNRNNTVKSVSKVDKSGNIVKTFTLSSVPNHCAIDLFGNVYIILDTENKIAKIDTSDNLTYIDTTISLYSIFFNMYNDMITISNGTTICIFRNDVLYKTINSLKGFYSTAINNFAVGDPTGIIPVNLFNWTIDRYHVNKKLTYNIATGSQVFDVKNAKRIRIEVSGDSTFTGSVNKVTSELVIPSNVNNLYVNVASNNIYVRENVDDVNHNLITLSPTACTVVGNNVVNNDNLNLVNTNKTKIDSPTNNNVVKITVMELYTPENDSVVSYKGSKSIQNYNVKNANRLRLSVNKGSTINGVEDPKSYSVPILAIDKGTSTYSSCLTCHQCVIKESDTSYKMWFSGYDEMYCRLLYSTSVDGKVWSTPILVMDKGTCAYNSNYSFIPYVIKESDTSYKMWFTGSDGTNMRILYSTSTDGKVWSTPILVMDKGTCSYNGACSYSPHVVKESNTSYKMWFSGSDNISTNFRLLYSTSTDGKVWSTPILVMDKGTCSYNSINSHSPFIIKESNTSYGMWFSGYDGTSYRILYSTSTDGKVWSTPIVVMDKGTCSYNAKYQFGPCVIKESDTSYKIWSSGSDNAGTWRILYSEIKTTVEYGDRETFEIDSSVMNKINMGIDINKQNSWSDPVLVMDKGTCTYNTNNSSGAFILKESDTSYKMWFAGTSSDGKCRILYSTSTDTKTWSTPILAMDTGTCAHNSLYSHYPYIIKESDTSYKMWFCGYDGTNTRILYSTSTDGKVWSTPISVMDKGTCSYNSGHSHSPYVIKESDTSYKMWFCGADGTNYRLLYSTSTDGKVWSTPILVMDKGTCGYNGANSTNPSVIKESDTSYKMWFNGFDGNTYRILYSTSTDGKNWSIPILSVDVNTCIYNTINSAEVKVIKNSNKYIMTFSGVNSTGYRVVYSESNNGFGITTDKGDTLISIDKNRAPAKYHKQLTKLQSNYALIKDGYTYHLYYSDSTDGVGGTFVIRHTTSTDLINWTAPNLVIDKGYAVTAAMSYAPTVIKDGPIFKMWFIGAPVDGSDGKIYYTSSSDNNVWSIPVLVLDKNLLSNNAKLNTTPTIIKDNLTYKMWFIGKDASNVNTLLYTNSTDGVNWITPVVSLSNNDSVYNTETNTPFVIKEDNIYKLFFGGKDSFGISRILYSESVDGSVWGTIKSLYEGNKNVMEKSIYNPVMIRDIGKNHLFMIGAGYDGYAYLLSKKYNDDIVFKDIDVVMDISGCDYDIKGSYSPSIIKESDTSYKMWFTGADINANSRILYSTSTDGKVWSTPILVMDVGTCTYNSSHSYCPTVIKESDTSYKMWFGANDSSNIRILYSTSTDGKVWSTPILVMDKGTCSYNTTNSSYPMVIKKSDTSYKMWFTGYDGTFSRILYSTSTDGKTWSVPILVMDKNISYYLGSSMNYPYIIKLNNIYTMLFSSIVNGINRLFITKSTDGINWSNPKILLDAVDYSSGFSTPCFIKENDKYRLWASAHDGANWRIIYTESEICEIEEFSRKNITLGDESYSPKLVTDKGTCIYNSNWSYTPYIIKESDTSYKMWFTGSDGTNYRILYSTSTDCKTWSTPILVMNIGTCTYNSRHSMYPSIIKESDTSYKMWFSGDDGPNHRILYSTSTDGIVWNSPVPVMDKGTCSYNTQYSHMSSVIKESDTSYKMWFCGYDGTNTRILYSTSTDGKAWSTPILVMDKGTCAYNPVSSYSPSIIKESDTSYKMWFSGHDGTYYRLLYSTSTDGKVWSAPILVMDKGTCTYNSSCSYTPHAIKESDTSYKIWFGGFDGTTWRILYSTSTDGIHWTKINKEEITIENISIQKNVINTSENSIDILILDKSLPYSFKAGDKVKFNYKGSPDRFFTGNIKNMKIECYGAKGADSSISAAYGGKGGYVYGELNTSLLNKIYIFVGSKGGVGSNCGYNGGGYNIDNTLTKYYGGGATDIRTKLNDMYSRFIVAGGGGSSDTSDGNANSGYFNGGDGGGWIGSNGPGTYYGSGGTQTSGGTTDPLQLSGDTAGSFGHGSYNTITLSSGTATMYGAGGGGWYGGGNGAGGGGGGGSSYAAGNASCPTTHPEGITLSNSGTISGSNNGDGYVVLTVLETSNDDGSKMILNGSGPSTWNHDLTIFGVSDMNGNLNEFVTGLKLKDKTIYVIKDNDAAINGKNLLGNSPDWKMIDTSGNYIDSGIGMAYNYSADQANVAFKDIAATLTPILAKALGLIPLNTTTTGLGYLNLKISGEYLAYRGGYYNSLDKGGIFNLSLLAPFTSNYPHTGFRICYYKP